MRHTRSWLTIAALSTAIAGTTLVAGAQTIPTPTAGQTPTVADITVTGCLIQGSSMTVFLLDNARKDPTNSKETGQRYFVVNKIEDVQLKALVNHEVTATGTVTTRSDVRPATPPVAEKDLPVLTTRSMASIADRCMANAGR